VSEKKADKQRFWITYLLKDLKEGDTFSPDLLHLTLIPWFVTDKDSGEVVKSFREHFSGRKSFKITINGHDEFKNTRKIPVNLITHTREIDDLHQKALQFFELMQARWAVKNPYVDTDYIPHVRRRPGHNISEGETLNINSLSLVSARRRGDDLRTVAAKVNFHE
jgi:2'-5' RNA ligase